MESLKVGKMSKVGTQNKLFQFLDCYNLHIHTYTMTPQLSKVGRGEAD